MTTDTKRRHPMIRALPAPLSLPSVPWMHVASWIGLAWFAWFLGGWGQGGDAQVYYAVAFPPDYSESSVLTPSYNYSPAFALWVQPLQVLPWQAFYTLVLAASLASLAYLVSAPVALLLVLIQAPLVYRELLEGNLNLVAAALVVLAFRSPWLYAPMLLSKVTPGIGLMWFAVRREWRALGIMAAVTLAVVLPTLLVPGAWLDWFGLLLANEGQAGTVPLMIRVPVALGLVAWGALNDRRWTVPLAVAMTFPANYLGWVVALGVIRLGLRQRPDLDVSEVNGGPERGERE